MHEIFWWWWCFHARHPWEDWLLKHSHSLHIMVLGCELAWSQRETRPRRQMPLQYLSSVPHWEHLGLPLDLAWTRKASLFHIWGIELRVGSSGECTWNRCRCSSGPLRPQGERVQAVLESMDCNGDCSETERRNAQPNRRKRKDMSPLLHCHSFFTLFT